MNSINQITINKIISNHLPSNQPTKQEERFYKQVKPKQQISQIDPRSKQQLRQFGVDITNISNGSFVQTRKEKMNVDVKNDYFEKKHIYKIQESKGDSSFNKMDLDLSTMSNKMKDEPVLTRTQYAEKVLLLNPQLAIEYIESITETLFSTQNNKNLSLYPYPNYMRNIQNDINDKMRIILFDWIVDVHFKWKLLPETLYLTFNLIDRYLGLKSTSREELQCVGVSALLIACKYEEIYFPDLADFKEITDNSFEKSNILHKEYDILSKLSFDVTVPSALRFFELFNIFIKLEGVYLNYGLYILELCAFSYQMIKYKPSLIAAGVLMIIVNTNSVLKEKLIELSCHSPEEIGLVCKDIILMYQKVDNGSKSIKKKYSSSKFGSVGQVDIIEELAKRS